MNKPKENKKERINTKAKINETNKIEIRELIQLMLEFYEDIKNCARLGGIDFKNMRLNAKIIRNKKGNITSNSKEIKKIREHYIWHANKLKAWIKSKSPWKKYNLCKQTQEERKNWIVLQS